MIGKGELAHLAQVDADLTVRVTPKASRNMVEFENRKLRVYVTCMPEGGKATAMVQKLLAKALGVAKTRLVLVRGATSRDKVFRLKG